MTNHIGQSIRTLLNTLAIRHQPPKKPAQVKLAGRRYGQRNFGINVRN
ncbi:MAG TPA: hypothetical protein VIN59_04815 [Alphaproteobacteria bacterium]